MKKFRKIWDEKTNTFLIAHKDLIQKGKMPQIYEQFIKNFPESNVSFCAFRNQCSRLHVSKHMARKKGTKCRPLYAEHLKKGYVKIKIAQPNIWISKAKWVYMETHPWENFTERSNYIFLDGNNRNFSPENIERVLLKFMGIFCSLGGCEYGNPELTRLRVTQAKLKYALLTRAEKMNLITKVGSSRRLKSEINEWAFKYRHRPDVAKRLAERRKEYWRHLKEDPQKYEEKMEKIRALAKINYAKKKKK